RRVGDGELRRKQAKPPRRRALPLRCRAADGVPRLGKPPVLRCQPVHLPQRAARLKRQAQDGVHRRKVARPWWRATRAQAGADGRSRWSRWFSRSAEAEAPTAPAAAAAAPATPSGGGFQLQLANSRSEAEAQALWKKVSSENQEVAGAQPVIEKVDIGNFGTFYSLKIGPFPDKAESLKVCNALQRNAVDCSLVTQ